MSHLPILALVSISLAMGCGGDDPAATFDAAPACSPALDPTPITCTDDTPCTAACASAYCYEFGQVGQVCTNACTEATDCPTGWSCNNMGRCRPPN